MKKVREGYKITELGEIPNEWKIKKLGELTKVIRGASPRPKGDPRYYGGNIPRLMIADVSRDGKYVIPQIDFLTEEGAKKSRPMKKGDLVISISGTVALPTFLAVDACIHDGFMGFIEIDESILKEFLYYQILYLRELLISQATDGGVYINLTTDIVKDFNILVPSINEQEKIALILSTVDEQIDNVDELIQKNKELKKGLMQQLLTKGIGHTKFKKTEIGEIPEEWEVIKLSELAEIKRGASPRPINNPKWFSENKKVGWIRISDVTKTKKYLKKTEQYLSEEGIAKSRLVKPNNLIMSICATVGKPIILKMEACIHDGFILFDNLDRSRVNINYLYYLLQKKEEEFKSMGQTGTQANLNTNLVGSTLIALPKIQEQEKMELILSEVDEKIEEYENKKQKLEELKKGLMQQLLTGKVRVI